MYLYLPKTGRKNLFSIRSYEKFTKYWISLLHLKVKFIFDDVIRKLPISAKIFLYSLKTYVMVYVIRKFRHFRFSQSEDKGASAYYVITEGGGGVSKTLMCDCGVRRGGLALWWNKQISFFYKVKQKANNYLLCIFVKIVATIHFYGFPPDLSPVVLLKIILCFYIKCYINVKNC